jgi:hypothetical protein
MTAAMVTATEIAGVVGAALAGLAYVPQLSRLIGSHCSAGISLLAEEVWLLASFLTTARAIAIHAGVFIVLGGTQIVSTTLIMLYVARYRGTPCTSPSASAVQRQDTAPLGARRPGPEHRSQTADTTHCPPTPGVTRRGPNTTPGMSPSPPRGAVPCPHPFA